MPCSCAASSASAICFAIGSASSSGIGAARDALRQILALDEFHHERGDAAALLRGRRSPAMFGWFSDASTSGFALKAREPIVVRGERGRQNLDGDLAFELRVRRAVDLAHAAGADGGDDFIGAETRAGSEGQRWRDYMAQRTG